MYLQPKIHHMKLFFRFPELLLPIAILLAPILVGNKALDIQLHDTYYISNSTTWQGKMFFVPVTFLLIMTWLTHLLARRYDLLSVKVRWIQVGLTLLSLAIMVAIMSSRLFIGSREFYSFDETSTRQFFILIKVFNGMLLLFTLTQLVFWISVIASAIRKKVYHK